MRCLQMGVLVALALSTTGRADESCKEYEACALLTQADVAKAIGGTYGPGQTGLSSCGSATTPEVKQCRYTGGRNSAQIGFTLRCASSGDNDSNAAKLELETLFQAYTAVNGLGDEAYWGAEGKLGELNVMIGRHLSLVFTVHVSGAYTMDKALVGVKKLAATVIRRL